MPPKRSLDDINAEYGAKEDAWLVNKAQLEQELAEVEAAIRKTADLKHALSVQLAVEELRRTCESAHDEQLEAGAQDRVGSLRRRRKQQVEASTVNNEQFGALTWQIVDVDTTTAAIAGTLHSREAESAAAVNATRSIPRHTERAAHHLQRGVRAAHVEARADVALNAAPQVTVAAPSSAPHLTVVASPLPPDADDDVSVVWSDTRSGRFAERVYASVARLAAVASDPSRYAQPLRVSAIVPVRRDGGSGAATSAAGPAHTDTALSAAAVRQHVQRALAAPRDAAVAFEHALMRRCAGGNPPAACDRVIGGGCVVVCARISAPWSLGELPSLDLVGQQSWFPGTPPAAGTTPPPAGPVGSWCSFADDRAAAAEAAPRCAVASVSLADVYERVLARAPNPDTVLVVDAYGTRHGNDSSEEARSAAEGDPQAPSQVCRAAAPGGFILVATAADPRHPLVWLYPGDAVSPADGSTQLDPPLLALDDLVDVMSATTASAHVNASGIAAALAARFGPRKVVPTNATAWETNGVVPKLLPSDPAAVGLALDPPASGTQAAAEPAPSVTLIPRGRTLHAAFVNHAAQGAAARGLRSWTSSTARPPPPEASEGCVRLTVEAECDAVGLQASAFEGLALHDQTRKSRKLTFAEAADKLGFVAAHAVAAEGPLLDARIASRLRAALPAALAAREARKPLILDGIEAPLSPQPSKEGSNTSSVLSAAASQHAAARAVFSHVGATVLWDEADGCAPCRVVLPLVSRWRLSAAADTDPAAAAAPPESEPTAPTGETVAVDETPADAATNAADAPADAATDDAAAPRDEEGAAAAPAAQGDVAAETPSEAAHPDQGDAAPPTEQRDRAGAEADTGSEAPPEPEATPDDDDAAMDALETTPLPEAPSLTAASLTPSDTDAVRAALAEHLTTSFVARALTDSAPDFAATTTTRRCGAGKPLATEPLSHYDLRDCSVSAAASGDANVVEVTCTLHATFIDMRAALYFVASAVLDDAAATPSVAVAAGRGACSLERGTVRVDERRRSSMTLTARVAVDTAAVAAANRIAAPSAVRVAHDAVDSAARKLLAYRDGVLASHGTSSATAGDLRVLRWRQDSSFCCGVFRIETAAPETVRRFFGLPPDAGRARRDVVRRGRAAGNGALGVACLWVVSPGAEAGAADAAAAQARSVGAKTSAATQLGVVETALLVLDGPQAADCERGLPHAVAVQLQALQQHGAGLSAVCFHRGTQRAAAVSMQRAADGRYFAAGSRDESGVAAVLRVCDELARWV